MTKIDKIIQYLDKLIPNPSCELNYSKDYELLLAVMLSAQTTDIRVNMVTAILFKKYPSIKSLKEADINDIIKIIKPIGTYQKKANNIKLIAERLYNETNGKVINDRFFLESLPGVGRKTANVVLSILFNEPCIAVDTHVSRVSVRLNLANTKDNLITIEKKITKKFKKYNLSRIHHQLVLFGRYYCKSRNPSCPSCELFNICKAKERFK